MSGRIEYKYLVPNHLVDRIRADLRPHMEGDQFAGTRGEYTVRSIYYDTPRFACYDEKLAGIELRRKFRIRGYDRPGADSIVFLEIKRKQAAFIRKSRAPLRYADLDAFFASRDVERYILSPPGTRREQDDAVRFLYHYYGLGLRPAVLVVYDREAFHGKHDASLRVTFDKNLRGSVFPTLDRLYDDDCLAPAMSSHFVLEVKFFRNALPSWVGAMIGRYELPRMALSKFTICLDSHATLWRAERMRSGVYSPVRNTA